MAIRAWSGAVLGELLAVRLLVAVFAFARRRLEVDIDQLGPQVRRFVAVDAGCGLVGAAQRECRLVMIEAGEFLP